MGRESGMTNVLSIDFDFWAEMPNVRNLDWGFRESKLFIEMIWQIRATDFAARGSDIRKECYLAKDEPSPISFAGLMKKLKVKIAKNQVAISESHAVAYNYFKDLHDMRVVHVDAHHDLGYGNKELNCDNWLQHLITDGNVDEVDMIYPKWRNNDNCRENYDERRKAILKQLDRKVKFKMGYGLAENIPGSIKFDKVFICRSGSWSPPWLDRDWSRLVSAMMVVFGHDSMGIYGAESFEAMHREMDWSKIKRDGEAMGKVIAGMKCRT